jgi:tetratricopeptide (TPR) repeat protein
MVLVVMVLSPWFWGCGNDSASDAETSQAEVIFRSKDGKVLTVEDLDQATGNYDFEIVGGGDYEISVEANRLHQQGRQLGAAGKYEESSDCFLKAHQLAPKWPYPLYDLAYNYLLKEDFEKAREYYTKTVELAPRGFFTAITALDTLEREAAGDLPERTYLSYLSLEWVEEGEQKSQMVKLLTEKYPDFAPGWKEYALLCEAPADSLAAIEKGLTADPDAETEGILLLNKAMTLNEMGQHAEAVDILGNLAVDPSTTFGNEQLAKQMLRRIIVEGD